MSRIALNARLLIPGKLEGTGRFTHQCYKRLISSRPDDEFLLIFDRTPDGEFNYGHNAKNIYLLPPARRPWLFDLWFDFAITNKLKSWKADAFVSTDGYLSRRTSIPQLNVIHDINFEHHPEWLPSRYARHFKSRFPQYAKIAASLCTVSEFSKRDISEKYGVNLSDITVIPNAPDESFKPSSELNRKESRDKYTKGNPYFVFVGSLHPRKNIPGVINAFEEYKKLGGIADLLMIGTSMWRDEKLASKNVHYAGRLNNTDLVNAISAAEALLYLPFFEGFGVPVVEAMACGVPVVSSNTSSLPEVCGGAAAALVSPTDYISAAKSLMKLEVDDDFHKLKSNAGILRASEFNWDRSAVLLSDQIDKILAL